MSDPADCIVAVRLRYCYGIVAVLLQYYCGIVAVLLLHCCIFTNCSIATPLYFTQPFSSFFFLPTGEPEGSPHKVLPPSSKPPSSVNEEGASSIFYVDHRPPAAVTTSVVGRPKKLKQNTSSGSEKSSKDGSENSHTLLSQDSTVSGMSDDFLKGEFDISLKTI